MMYFTTGKDRYWYEIYGDQEPVIVFLHGFTGRTTTWKDVMPFFHDTHRVVLVDLPGHGRSLTGRKTMEACTRDLEALFRELELDQIHLVGYSMGGRTALSYATAFPERVKTLTLESASPGIAEPDKRQARMEHDEALATRIETEGIEAFVEFWENIPLFDSQKKMSSDQQTAIKAERLSQTEAGLSASLRGMGTGAQPSLWHHLADVACPVLLITGEHDPKFVQISAAMKEKLPNPQLHVVPQTGHAIHVEVPSVFGKILNRFIQQHT